MSATQHIEWLNLIEKTGPFLAVGVLDEAFPQGLDKVETRQRQRVRSAYDEWRDAVDADDPNIDAYHHAWVRLILQELLDYDPSVLKPQSALPGALAFREPLTGVTVRPDYATLSGDTPRLLVAHYAPDTDLSAPLADDAWIASPIERMNQLCRALGVRLGLVTDGERWAVVSVPADTGSSVATWFARIWQQEPVTLQAFVSLLGVRRCFGKAEDTFDSLLLRSQGHQNEITDTLGEQVRRAVEVLVQALDQADVAHNRQLLVGVSPGQLYEAGLTVMMRLVILLCAEQRKLLLLGEKTYDQHYAVTTLRARLAKEQTDLTDEVLERRHDAWSRLLAVCRAVFGGIEHDTLRLPPLGGSLFDPDRFPFLEGRAAGSSWRDTPASPLPIDNRTVLMLLTALQVLEQSGGAQMLSYEALDVEQIGHVYEGLLERTVKRVPEVTLGLIGSAKSVNPVATLRELEEQAASGITRLVSFLEERTGRSVPALSKAVEKPVDDALAHRIAIACGSSQSLASRLRPFAHLLREDNWKRFLVYKADSFIVTLGAGRRETGTHYTPKSLTEPIVQHTLEPLVYIGPAEGKSQPEWQLRTPAELLALKICDMAMGSAAFLVQVCRYLGERLVESWEVQEQVGKMVTVEGVVLEQDGSSELLPKDRSERTLIARRLIASRCLYGVDINPMAVELAKVGLWLVTMMKGRPFNFIDHALKCGDSLLGVSSVQQIENFSLRPGERQVTFATANLSHYVEDATAKRRVLEEMPSNDNTQIEAKNRLHVDAEAATAKVKAVADCLIAFELRGLDGDAYEDQRTAGAEKVQLLLTHDADSSLDPQKLTINQLSIHGRAQLRGCRTFHWPVEFPEVFTRGGFDAFVGNPPFVGGKKITGIVGEDYRNWIVRNLASGEKGAADLSAYFLLRAHALTNRAGYHGLIATNAIADGDTERVGLRQIVNSSGQICRAYTAIQWPGDAGVVVAIIWWNKADWLAPHILDDVAVPGISSQLAPIRKNEADPYPLRASCCSSFAGTYVNGEGFILSDEEAERLQRDPKNRDIILRYLIGDDINSRTNQLAARWVIDFKTMSQEEAQQYKDCFAILTDRVKPYRDTLTKQIHEEDYWKFWDKRVESYREIARFSRVLVAARASKYVQLSWVRNKQIFSDQVVVFVTECDGVFACLQSTIHGDWAWERCTGMWGAGIRYAPSKAVTTFALPKIGEALTAIGKRYFETRGRIEAERSESLTSVYNRLHDRAERSADIVQLRALHEEMDRAVAAAYGWSDLDLGHGFHATKQGERYALSEHARRTVLDRLLALNHERYAEEVAAGLHEKKKGGSRRRRPPESFSELELH
jgi:hypothetical protein